MRPSTSRSLAPWLFLAPALVLIIGFLAYPLGRSLWLAMHKTAGPAYSEFVGLGHLRFLLQDGQFWTALFNSLLYAVCFVVLQIGISLVLALALEQRRNRLTGAVRLMLFAPHLVGAVFAAMIAGKMLHQAGTINLITGLQVDWLRDPHTAMAAIILVALWLGIGFAVVYLQAALQAVDRSLIEAAMLDGAGPWDRFRMVVWPTIRPTVSLLTLVGTIAALQVFELPYLLTQGGPGNHTLTLGLYLYRQGFEQGSLGYAAAVGWMMALVVGLAGMLLIRRDPGGMR